MYLFIFESLGTSELILIGIVALIFLGPRKMPQMARKIGKIMSEFRGTANEFKETWQREVDFSEEAKALDLNAIEAESTSPAELIQPAESPEQPDAPTIKEVDPSAFEHLRPTKTGSHEELAEKPESSDKKNWL